MEGDQNQNPFEPPQKKGQKAKSEWGKKLNVGDLITNIEPSITVSIHTSCQQAIKTMTQAKVKTICALDDRLTESH